MSDYIRRDKLLLALREWQNTLIETYGKNDEYVRCLESVLTCLENVPAANVLPLDEAIKMGAEFAAMHGSDATSQQLEEAYLKGVEDGMTRRDVRPVVRGKWIKCNRGAGYKCSVCKARHSHADVLNGNHN